MDWTTEPAIYSETGLVIKNLSIVENWEKPIQEILAKSVIKSSQDVILEIGYGLGFASQAVVKSNPLHHILIEAHPSIAEKAKRELPANVSVIVALWQNAIYTFKESSFDGVIFDAYPLDDFQFFDGTPESTLEYVKPFLKRASKLLKSGGLLSFLDFSCQIDTLKEFQGLVKSNYSQYKIINVPLIIPGSCTYAKGVHGNVIVVTK